PAGPGRRTGRPTPWSGVPPASISDRGTLGGSTGVASGINASGEVAGWSYTPDGPVHPVVWTRTGTGSFSITDLGALPGGIGGEAQAINAAGQVTGYSEAPDFTQRAAVWTPNGSGSFRVTDLGALPGGGFTTGYAIGP